MNGHGPLLHGVLGVRVGHQLERFVALLQRLHQAHGVGEDYVVVGHAVHQQQSPLDAVEVGERAAGRVGLRIVRRLA